MLAKVECWFFGPEKYLPQGGRGSDLLFKRVIELEVDRGWLNPPILTLELDGQEKHFRFNAEVGSVLFYREAKVQKL